MKRPRRPVSTGVKFVKASACGNDFMIIVARDADLAGEDPQSFTRRICDRHNGVGADGVEWLYPTDQADIEARMLNCDGSAAEISGNGTRCVAAYWANAASIEGVPAASVSILTGAGIKHCRLNSHQDWKFEFEVDMGIPRVEDKLTLNADGLDVEGYPVSMGNPHFVVFIDGAELDAKERIASAAAIARHEHFPQGVNVEFVEVMDSQNLRLRIFERGAGETMSSGTGSCAAAAAAFVTFRVKSPVNVHSAGGKQRIVWDGHREMLLAGLAEIICRGEFLH